MRDVETVSGLITFGGFQAPQSRQLRVLRHSNGRLVFEDFLEVRQDGDLPIPESEANELVPESVDPEESDAEGAESAEGEEQDDG